MAKLTRESKLRERRLDKQARREARKHAQPDQPTDTLGPGADAATTAADTLDPAADALDAPTDALAAATDTLTADESADQARPAQD